MVSGTCLNSETMVRFINGANYWPELCLTHDNHHVFLNALTSRALGKQVVQIFHSKRAWFIFDMASLLFKAFCHAGQTAYDCVGQVKKIHQRIFC